MTAPFAQHAVPAALACTCARRGPENCMLFETEYPAAPGARDALARDARRRESVMIKMNNQHANLGPSMPVSPWPMAYRHPNLRRPWRRHSLSCLCPLEPAP
eukprot:scaffold30451_cov72-Phaeocystis_antarctica.AAC.3